MGLYWYSDLMERVADERLGLSPFSRRIMVYE